MLSLKTSTWSLPAKRWIFVVLEVEAVVGPEVEVALVGVGLRGAQAVGDDQRAARLVEQQPVVGDALIGDQRVGRLQAVPAVALAAREQPAAIGVGRRHEGTRRPSTWTTL